MGYKTHGEMIEEVRSRFNEPAAASASNRFITRLLNQGAQIIAGDLYAIDDINGIALVANQQEYDLPTDFMVETGLIYEYGLQHIKLKETSKMELLKFQPIYGTPYAYAIDRANYKVFLYPAPSASAAATTLTGNHTAAATTIIVASTTSFSPQGRVKIGDEVIQYTGITTTTLTGCTRGADDTTAASHLDTVAVTRLNLYFFHSRKPKNLQRLYSTGTVTYVNGDATVTLAGSTWDATKVKAGDYIGLGAFSTTAASETFPVKWYKIASVTDTTHLELTEVYAEASSSTQAYIACDSSELQESDCEIPVLFAIRELTAKYSSPEKYSHANGRLQTEVVKAMNRLNSADYIPQSRMETDGNSNFSPRLPSDVYPQGGN